MSGDEGEVMPQGKVTALAALLYSSSFGCAFQESHIREAAPLILPSASPGPQASGNPATPNNTVPSPVASAEPSSHSPRPSPTQVQNQFPADPWEEMRFQTEVSALIRKSLSPKAKEKLKQKFGVAKLREVHSEFSGNYSLYQILSAALPEEGKDSVHVFILPKVYVYGSATKVNGISLADTSSDEKEVIIPISFIDGLRSTLPGLNGVGAIALPTSLTISDLRGLKEDLKRQFGKEVRLEVLPACPVDLSLTYHGSTSTKKYPLKAIGPETRRCMINQFAPHRFRAPKGEVDALINEGLNDGFSVQIAAQYRLEFRDPVAFNHLKLESKAALEFLKNQLNTAESAQNAKSNAKSDSRSDSESHSKSLAKVAEELLFSELKRAGLDPRWLPLSEGVRLIEDTFFRKEGQGEGSLVKKPSELPSEPLELSWIEEEVLAVTNPISTSAPVQSVTNSFPFSVRSQGSTPIHSFQVFPGAKVRVSLSRITEWRKEFDLPRDDMAPSLQRDTLKCADEQVVAGGCSEYRNKCPVALIDFCQQPKDECEIKERIFQDHCSESTVFERSCGFLGLGYCTDRVKERHISCQKIETGDFCKKYKMNCQVPLQRVCPVEEVRECVAPIKACEEYTVESFSKYTFSTPFPKPRVLDLEIGETPQQLWEGIYLEFTSRKSDGSVEQVVCPILDFPHWLEGRLNLVVRLENRSAGLCHPFNGWNSKDGNLPSIAILNKISFERKYRCGSLEWTHSVLVNSKSGQHTQDRMTYSCPETGASSSKSLFYQYLPEVDLEGYLSILGRSMQNLETHGETPKGARVDF